MLSFLSLQMYGSLFLLQGLHLRLDMDKLYSCDNPNVDCDCTAEGFHACLENRTASVDNDTVMVGRRIPACYGAAYFDMSHHYFILQMSQYCFIVFIGCVFVRKRIH